MPVKPRNGGLPATRLAMTQSAKTHSATPYTAATSHHGTPGASRAAAGRATSIQPSG